MLRVTEVGFSIRTDADLTPDEPTKPFVSPEDMASTLEPALGCTFREGTFCKAPALVAEALGVTISLLPWRGIGGKSIFQLCGEVLEARLLRSVPARELVRIDIGRYIVDLLNVRTPFLWYVPSRADLAAENEYAREIDRAYDW
ncbi:hypothetical protein ABGB14_11530 [Nonomuraea sp. B10E15]|uniref:hypothetical protein n=1 Tax=Nonomuraea sp. B10E15 TaxID=3153560 RepID=UPI00325DC89B